MTLSLGKQLTFVKVQIVWTGFAALYNLKNCNIYHIWNNFMDFSHCGILFEIKIKTRSFSNKVSFLYQLIWVR
jgi:hypothetical protein